MAAQGSPRDPPGRQPEAGDERSRSRHHLGARGLGVAVLAAVAALTGRATEQQDAVAAEGQGPEQRGQIDPAAAGQGDEVAAGGRARGVDTAEPRDPRLATVAAGHDDTSWARMAAHSSGCSALWSAIICSVSHRSQR